VEHKEQIDNDGMSEVLRKRAVLLDGVQKLRREVEQIDQPETLPIEIPQQQTSESWSALEQEVYALRVQNAELEENINAYNVILSFFLLMFFVLVH
jgi:predicted nuclease with TOPRIM domain